MEREQLISFSISTFHGPTLFPVSPHLKIISQLNFILLPPSTGPTGQFKITPHTNGEVTVFSPLLVNSVHPSACLGKRDLDLRSDPA